MIQEKSWYCNVMKLSSLINKIINFVCVILLTAQTISILIMVFGRYIFSAAPQWTEQFALFCMIWFAMLSIALAVRTDSHVKMEVVDSLVSPKNLRWFKLFGSVCTGIFGLVMVVYGVQLCALTWGTKLSALHISTGLQYMSAVAGGFFMILNAVVFCIEMFGTFHDEQLKKEEE